jgi:hypothetical protein
MLKENVELKIFPLTKEEFDKAKKGEILFKCYHQNNLEPIPIGIFCSNRFLTKKELKNPIEGGWIAIPLSVEDLSWKQIDSKEKVFVQHYKGETEKENLDVAIVSDRIANELTKGGHSSQA